MNDEKQREEEKRLRCADPVLLWEVTQRTAEWIDSQQPISRAGKAGCLLRQDEIDAARSSVEKLATDQSPN